MDAVTAFLYPSSTENSSAFADALSRPPSPIPLPQLDHTLLASFQSSEHFADETAAALIAVAEGVHDASQNKPNELTRPRPRAFPRPEALIPLATYNRDHHVPFLPMPLTPPISMAILPLVSVSAGVLPATPVCDAVITQVATAPVHADLSLPLRILPELTLASSSAAGTLSIGLSQSPIGGSTPGLSMLSFSQLTGSTDHGPQPSLSPLLSARSSNHAVAESVGFSLISIGSESSPGRNVDNPSALTTHCVQALPASLGSRHNRVRKWIWNQRR